MLKRIENHKKIYGFRYNFQKNRYKKSFQKRGTSQDCLGSAFGPLPDGLGAPRELPRAPSGRPRSVPGRPQGVPTSLQNRSWGVLGVPGCPRDAPSGPEARFWTLQEALRLDFGVILGWFGVPKWVFLSIQRKALALVCLIANNGDSRL